MLTDVVDYFTTMPDSHRIAVLVLSLFSFWLLEQRENWRLTYARRYHALTNAAFVTVSGLVQLVFGILLIKDLNWVADHHWGIAYTIPGMQSPVWHFIIVFLVLDFLEYVYHVFMHRYANLWKFHAIHHADPNVDVSTVLREHPGETAIRLTFLLLFVFISGATFWALMARQFLQIISNVTAHAHLRLPEKWDKALSYVFVTPNFHHVHHHVVQPYTDSNYGDVLTIWDRFFGTFRTLNVHELRFGLDTHPEPDSGATFGYLLQRPFIDLDEEQPVIACQTAIESEANS